MDMFDQKGLSPMLLHEERQPFDSDDYLFELKLDGIRCLAYLDETTTDLRNKVNFPLVPIFPELGQLHKAARGKLIVDGELIVAIDGKPNFESIQSRALMSNKFKIELASTAHPASYVAFDILYCDGEDLTQRPLIERKAILTEMILENERIAVSRYHERNGVAFFELTKQSGLEGIVAKHKDALYHLGKRTRDWIKIKNLIDEDFVACGYIPKDNNFTSLVLGQHQDGILKHCGHVTLGVSLSSVSPFCTSPICPFAIVHEGDENARWFDPLRVCTVVYMARTSAGGMRQPRFKGFRDDKYPQEV